MLTRKLLLAGAALGACTIASAQDYFDFGRIPGLPDSPDVSVDLNAAMLGFVTETSRAANPAAADLLAGLEGVRVRIYNAIEDVSDVVGYLDDASSRLERQNWQQVVRVQEGGEVRIYMQSDGQSITGLTAMIIGDAEAIFVNVAGMIEPQNLGQLLNQFGAGEILAGLSGARGPQAAASAE